MYSISIVSIIVFGFFTVVELGTIPSLVCHIKLHIRSSGSTNMYYLIQLIPVYNYIEYRNVIIVVVSIAYISIASSYLILFSSFSPFFRRGELLI